LRGSDACGMAARVPQNAPEIEGKVVSPLQRLKMRWCKCNCSMIIEVCGRRIELDWKDAAVLLALLWVRVGALSLSYLHAIEADPGRLRARIDRLKDLGLIGEVKLGRGSVVYLTDLGHQVASLLERRAADLNILQREA